MYHATEQLSLPLLINYLIALADTSTEIEDEFLNNDDPTVAAPDILDNAGGNDDIPEIPDVDSDEDSDFEEDEDEDPNKLWCICQQPHNNRFMICCDSCSGLYFLAIFDNFWPSLHNLVFLAVFCHICQQPHYIPFRFKDVFKTCMIQILKTSLVQVCIFGLFLTIFGLRNLVFWAAFCHLCHFCQQPPNNRFMICCDSCSGLYSQLFRGLGFLIKSFIAKLIIFICEMGNVL